MPEFLIFITKFGLHHFLPLVIVVFIFFLLNKKTKEVDVERLGGVNLKFTAGVLMIVLIHLTEFLVESHELFELPYGELGVETAEIVLFYAAFGFFIWGIREAENLKKPAAVLEQSSV